MKFTIKTIGEFVPKCPELTRRVFNSNTDFIYQRHTKIEDINWTSILNTQFSTYKLSIGYITIGYGLVFRQDYKTSIPRLIATINYNDKVYVDDNCLCMSSTLLTHFKRYLKSINIKKRDAISLMDNRMIKDKFLLIPTLDLTDYSEERRNQVLKSLTDIYTTTITL